MTERVDQNPTAGLEAGLEDMSYREMAVDWVQRVLDLPPKALDRTHYVLSAEGFELIDEARKEHFGQYSGVSTTGPDETKRRQDELTEKIQAILDEDPGVIEKNQFLAMLLEQCDPDVQVDGVLDSLKEAAKDPREAAGDGVGDDVLDDAEIKKKLGGRIKVLAELEAAHTYNVLAFLRRFAERVGNNPATYQDQFLGLWAIYKAGQASAED